MNTNIYLENVMAAVVSGDFQLLKALLEQQVAEPRRSSVCAPNRMSPFLCSLIK